MKALFIHIPKTAGSTVANALNVLRLDNPYRPDTWVNDFVSYKHTYYADLPENVKHVFTFTWVRNPYDRAVSAWAFSNSKVGFKECIRRQNDRKLRTRIFRPQIEWTRGVPLNFVGRYEQLEEDVPLLARILNAPVRPLLHLNKSNHDSWPEYYDSEAYSLVQELYKEDFEAFGYPI